MLAAALAGLDAFVFTAGIGENSVTIRARIAGELAWLGVAFDACRQLGAQIADLAAAEPGRARRLPTDEELMIARHTLRMLSEGSTRKLAAGM